MSAVHRALGVGLVLCALVVVVGGTGGFYAGGADRPATIGLVEDSEAQVGVDTDECRLSNNGHVPVTLVVTTDDGDVEQFEAVQPGEARSVSVNGTARIRAVGTDVEADIVREFDCRDGGSEDGDDDGDGDGDGDDGSADGGSA